MTDLKPCPFCGSKCDPEEVAYTKGDDSTIYHSPGCTKCNGSVNTVVEWKNRPLEDALTARIAELEGANDLLQGWMHEVKAENATLTAQVAELREALEDIHSINREEMLADPEYWGNKIVGRAKAALSNTGEKPYQPPEFAQKNWAVSQETQDHMEAIAKQQQAAPNDMRFGGTTGETTYLNGSEVQTSGEKG